MEGGLHFENGGIRDDSTDAGSVMTGTGNVRSITTYPTDAK